MLSPNQIRCLNDYYGGADSILYFCCERHDCDYEQMQEIVNALDPLLPGKGLDYQAILSKDPLASDALLIHCNQTIGRLDALYKRMMNLFDDSSRNEYTINKRTTVNVPPDWANPSFHDGKFHFKSEHNGTEKRETTTFPDKQRFKILETAMKCLDRSIKIQITCTNRREKLLNSKNPRLAATQRGALANTATAPHNQETPLAPETGLSAMTGMQAYSLNQIEEAFVTTNDYLAVGQAPPDAPAKTPTTTEQSQPETSASDSSAEHSALPSFPSFASVPKNPPSHSRESASTSGPTSQPAASARAAAPTTPAQPFGPPKDFTPNPNIAAVRFDHYAWRKELKAKKTTQTTPANSCQSLSLRGSDSLPYHQRE